MIYARSIKCKSNKYIIAQLYEKIKLQAHHFTHDTVCHLDRTDKDEHIEYQFLDIAPHHRDRSHIGIDHGRGSRKHRKDNAGKHDDCTLKAHGTITLDKAPADILARLSRKEERGTGAIAV